MNGKTISGILAICLAVTALGFYSLNKNQPEELGLHRANLDDIALVQLTFNRLSKSLQNGDAATLETLVATDFAVVEGNSSPKGAAKKLTFFKKSDLFVSGNQQKLSKITLGTPQISVEGDRATVTAPLRIGHEAPQMADFTFTRAKGQWQLQEAEKLAAVLNKTTDAGSENAESGFLLYQESAKDAGQTLIRKKLSAELDIEKLTRAVTEEKLDRELFGKPYAGVLVSSVSQLERAPFFTARYVQLVTDPSWNRIVYGDYDGWIKAYGNSGGPGELNRPHGIERDAAGRIYVADTGNNRIAVLRLVGNGDETELRFDFDFGNDDLSLPYDVAWDDSGTPFEPADDIIWVTDSSHNRVVGYALTGKSAEVRYTFGGYGSEPGQFMRPEGIAPARFNGACTGGLYVTDSGNRRVARLAVSENKVTWNGAFTDKEETQFTSVDVDHWGNVYASDRSYRQIAKLTEDLQPLAVLAGSENALNEPVNFNVIFGRVYLESENREIWSGYDQSLVVEKWSETSGAERYQLSLSADNLSVTLPRSLDGIEVNTRLTDHSRVTVAVFDKDGRLVRQMPVGWQVAGDTKLMWDRRDDLGWEVEPGYYRLQLSAESSYGRVTVTKETPDFYLPLYYHDDSGSEVQKDAHLVQGVRSNEWGSAPHETTVKHPSEVVYRFTDLNPSAQYEISAEFYNKAGHYLKQRITVDKAQLTDNFEVPAGLKLVEWKLLPRESFSDGEIAVGIAKVDGEGEAMLSQLWLREANYDPANAPVLQNQTAEIPETFTLGQNYPNPFNPTTTIQFGVPNGATGNVSLRIYNALGQTVRVLVDAPMNPGQHSVTWDGRDDFQRPIASGVYFYRLQAGEISQVKKLILMK